MNKKGNTPEMLGGSNHKDQWKGRKQKKKREDDLHGDSVNQLYRTANLAALGHHLQAQFCHSSLRDSEIQLSAASNCYVFPKLQQTVLILSVVKVTVALEHGMIWEMSYHSNAQKRRYDASRETDSGMCTSHG